MRDFSFERKTSLDKIVKRFKKVSKYEGQFSLTNILTFSRLPSLSPSLPFSLLQILSVTLIQIFVLSNVPTYACPLSLPLSFVQIIIHLVLNMSPCLSPSLHHTYALYLYLSLIQVLSHSHIRSLYHSYTCPLSLPSSFKCPLSLSHSFSLSFIHSCISSLSPFHSLPPSYKCLFSLPLLYKYYLIHTFVLSIIRTYLLSANHTWALSLLLSFNLSKSQNR